MEEEEFWFDNGSSKRMHFDKETGSFVDDAGHGPSKNFQNNDDFCNWLNKYLINQMIKRNFIEQKLPDGTGAPIYHTKNALNSPKKLLVIIQGSGRVQAGVWSVGVCAYHGLNAGSVLSDIEKAKKRDLEIIILNPNDKRNSQLARRFPETRVMMAKHTLSVFEDLIIPNKPEKVFILCHSMGGHCTLSLINTFPEWCIKHLKAVSMGDGKEREVFKEGFKLNKFCREKCVNWVRSSKALGKDLGYGEATTHRSANTNDHPLTMKTARELMWNFLDENGADKEDIPDNNYDEYIGKEELPNGENNCCLL